MTSLADLAARAETGDLFDDLRTLQQVRAETNRLEAGLVRRARNQGASWSQIAAALGVSKQAVHKKFGGSRLSR